MMRSVVTLLAPAGAAAATAIGILAAAAPAGAAGAAADLRVIGGAASSATVCGNVAAAQDLAKQRGMALQKSNCTAQATGGSVTLENVDIYVSAAALARNRDNPVLVALAGPAPGVAQDKCEHHRPNPGPGKQINKCWGVAKGGKVTLDNVTHVNRQADGSTVTRTIVQASIPAAAAPPGDGGSASAVCRNVLNHPLNQRDDCTGSAGGGNWSMHGVDAVIRHQDGTTSTRRGITVEVRGGAATAAIHCFNVTDGSGHVIQINVCNADAQGGNARLRNVTIHTAG
jgi:hypothetical protein